MKSSYKLLGLFWDRRPMPKDCPDFRPHRKLLNYSYPYEFFDRKRYERKINFSELLDVSSEEAIRKIIDEVKSCDMVAVRIDVEYHFFCSVFVKFIAKRALQIYKFLVDNLKETHVCIMAGTRFGKVVIEAINDFGLRDVVHYRCKPLLVPGGA